MELEDALRDALQRDAAELVPVGPGPDDARRRAFRRKRRMQSGVVVLSAAALVGATMVVIETRSSGHGPRIATQPSDPTPDLSWRAVDGTVSYDRGHLTTSDGVTYAISTAPGSQPSTTGFEPQELYATHDGVTWTHTSLGKMPWVVDLAADGGVLYALGTGPGAQSDETAYKVATSSDGGAHWAETPVPVEFTPPASAVRLQPSISTRIAHGEHTTVVIAKMSYFPDLQSMIGEGKGYRITAAGVDVFDVDKCKQMSTDPPVPQPCQPSAGQTRPWSDFGITDPAALQQEEALVRDDGGDWQRVQLPTSSQSWVQDVAATSNGFLLAESASTDSGLGSTQLLSSPDGRTWSPVGSVPAVDTVAISSDHVIGVNSGSAKVYVSNDAGSSWTATEDIAGLIPGDDPVESYGTAADVGPLGYAVVVHTGGMVDGTASTSSTAMASSPDTPNTLSPKEQAAPQHTYLLNSVDGATWKVTDLAAAGAPADGNVASTSVGADHIEVTYEEAIPAVNGGQPTWKLTTLVGTPKA